MDRYRSDIISFLNATKEQVFYCFDTETTGLSPVENDIIEFSALKVRRDKREFIVEDEIDFFINPGYPIPANITEITGITDETVKDGCNFKEAVEKIQAFWGDNPVLMGYNSISFDEPFIKNLYRKAGKPDFNSAFHLDVIKMVKEKSEKPFKLSSQAERAGIGEGFRFHRSIDDAKATLFVFEWVLPRYEKKETESSQQYSITAISRWSKYSIDRIYINNDKNISFFYDFGRAEWVFNNSNAEQSDIDKAFAFAGVRTQEEFFEKYK